MDTYAIWSYKQGVKISLVHCLFFWGPELLICGNYTRKCGILFLDQPAKKLELEYLLLPQMIATPFIRLTLRKTSNRAHRYIYARIFTPANPLQSF